MSSFLTPGRSPGFGLLQLLLVLVVLSVAAAVGYLLFLDLGFQQDAETEVTSTVPVEPPLDFSPLQPSKLTPGQLMRLVPLTAQVGSDAQGASQALPSLNQSDASVREGLEALSPDNDLTRWLISEELLRKFVVTVDNVAKGSFPRKHSFLAPIPAPFRAYEWEHRYWLDEHSFRRYDFYAELFSAIDPDAASALYQHYYPLLQQAYAELGYSKHSFHQALIRAVDQVLDSPVIEGPIELVRPAVFYKFADPNIEALPDLFKQMLRMGPTNRNRVVNKLSALRSRLVKLGHQ
jgi:hypothetical protein